MNFLLTYPEYSPKTTEHHSPSQLTTSSSDPCGMTPKILSPEIAALCRKLIEEVATADVCENRRDAKKNAEKKLIIFFME
jgi:hypothetical protein